MNNASFTFLTAIAPSKRRSKIPKMKYKTDWKLGKENKNPTTFKTDFDQTNLKYGKKKKNSFTHKSRKPKTDFLELSQCNDNINTSFVNHDGLVNDEIVQALHKLQISQRNSSHSIKSCSDSLHFSSEKSDVENLQNNDLHKKQLVKHIDENHLSDEFCSKITLRKHQKANRNRQKNLFSTKSTVKAEHNLSSSTICPSDNSKLLIHTERKHDLEASRDHGKIVCSTPDHVIPNFSLSSIEDSKICINSHLDESSTRKSSVKNTSYTGKENCFLKSDKDNQNLPDNTLHDDSYKRENKIDGSNVKSPMCSIKEASDHDDSVGSEKCGFTDHEEDDRKWTDCSETTKSEPETRKQMSNKKKTPKKNDSFIVSSDYSEDDESDILMYRRLIAMDIKNEAKKFRKGRLRKNHDGHSFTSKVKKTQHKRMAKEETPENTIDSSELSSSASCSSSDEMNSNNNKTEPVVKKRFGLLSESDISDSSGSFVTSTKNLSDSLKFGDDSLQFSSSTETNLFNTAENLTYKPINKNTSTDSKQLPETSKMFTTATSKTFTSATVSTATLKTFTSATVSTATSKRFTSATLPITRLIPYTWATVSTSNTLTPFNALTDTVKLRNVLKTNNNVASTCMTNENENDVQSTGLTIPSGQSKENKHVPTNNGLKKIILIPKNVITNMAPTKRHVSFLKSLDDDINEPFLPHPDAVRYRTNYNTYKDELVLKLFSLYDNEIFNNQLFNKVDIAWNRRLRTAGGHCRNMRTFKKVNGKLECTRLSLICLSAKLLISAKRLRGTLIHEMCHAACWIVDGMRGNHGPNWRRWTNKATDHFPELEPIKVRHDYEVQRKYTYFCKKCGARYHRFRQVKNMDTNKCGVKLDGVPCLGLFGMIDNTKKVKKSPTQLSKFALFVKDEYKTVQAENKHLKHKDVMKILSQKYKDQAK